MTRRLDERTQHREAALLVGEGKWRPRRVGCQHAALAHLQFRGAHCADAQSATQPRSQHTARQQPVAAMQPSLSEQRLP